MRRFYIFSEPPPRPPPADLSGLRIAGALAGFVLVIVAPLIFGPIVAGLYLLRWLTRSPA